MLDKTIVQRFNSAKNFIPPAYSISNLREGLNFYIPIIQAFIKKYEITDSDNASGERVGGFGSTSK